VCAVIKAVNHPSRSDGTEKQQDEGGKENTAGADLAPHSVGKGRLGLGQERNFIVDCILAYDINNGVIAAYPPRGRPTQGAISAYPTIRSASSPGTSAIRGFLDAVLRVESAGDKPQPFDGYLFRILTKQGDKVKGGAEDFIVSGKMTGGFAILAYPAEYRNSGIMTFIIGKDGIVYQKDLGEKTTGVASAMAEYNPGDGWTPAI